MNEMIKRESIPDQEEAKAIVADDKSYEPILDDGRIDGIFSEVLAWIRDNRTNTKRAISSAATARKQIQEQNMRLFNAYESELQRPGLTDERRDELLDKMDKTAESSEQADGLGDRCISKRTGIVLSQSVGPAPFSCCDHRSWRRWDRMVSEEVCVKKAKSQR